MLADWNGYPDVFSLSRTLEISRQYLLLRAVILQKKVIGWPWPALSWLASSISQISTALISKVRFLSKPKFFQVFFLQLHFVRVFYCDKLTVFLAGSLPSVPNKTGGSWRLSVPFWGPSSANSASPPRRITSCQQDSINIAAS